MAVEDRKSSPAQMQRIQERIRFAEGSSNPSLQNHVAAAGVAPRLPAATNNLVHIDFAQLQEAGIPTPLGGRTRVIDEYRLIKRTVLRNAACGVPRRTSQPRDGDERSTRRRKNLHGAFLGHERCCG